MTPKPDYAAATALTNLAMAPAAANVEESTTDPTLEMSTENKNDTGEIDKNDKGQTIEKSFRGKNEKFPMKVSSGNNLFFFTDCDAIFM